MPARVDDTRLLTGSAGRWGCHQSSMTAFMGSAQVFETLAALAEEISLKPDVCQFGLFAFYN